MMRRISTLRRHGSRSVVESEGLSSTVESRLDETGLGPYQFLVFFGIGGALMSEAIEMGAVAPLDTAFSRAYGLTHKQRSALPLITFMGSGAGLLLAGPLCDWRGRKAVLMSSLVVISAVSFITTALPEDIDPLFLLGLRFFAGFSGSIGHPAGCVLAVESCPSEFRSRLMFGIQMLGAIGYLIEAIGVQLLMPHFGEDPSDDWRSFCLLIGLVPLFVLPIIAMLYESPSFLAVHGDAEGCVEVLEGIAKMNMRPSPGRPQLPPQGHTNPKASRIEGLRQGSRSFWRITMSYWPVFVLLSVIDSARSFFVSGSSYLWKDLLMMAQASIFTPAALNTFVSVAPIIGIIVSERFIHIGVRPILFASSVVAICSMAPLLNVDWRSNEITVLMCVMLAKLTYGPLSTCISLVKAESFPTQIRVSAFAFISFVSKVTCTVAPTLIEAWKVNETATSWPSGRLQLYMMLLMIAALATGVLSIAVPGKSGEGKHWEDFVTDKRIQRQSVYGSFANIWELAGDDSDEDAVSGRGLKSTPSCPDIAFGDARASMAGRQGFAVDDAA